MDLAPAKDERQRTGISGKELDEAIAFREKMMKENQATPSNREGGSQDGGSVSERTPFLKNRNTTTVPPVKPRALSIDPLAPSQAFDKTLRERLGTAAETAVQDETPRDEVEEALPSEERILSRDFRAPTGKRVAIPVRIEPKVYFASERTFLVRLPSSETHELSLNHFHRNGFTSQSTLERSPQLSSTLPNQATCPAWSPLRCSLWRLCSPLPTPPPFLFTES